MINTIKPVEGVPGHWVRCLTLGEYRKLRTEVAAAPEGERDAAALVSLVKFCACDGDGRPLYPSTEQAEAVPLPVGKAVADAAEQLLTDTDAAKKA